MMTINNLQVDSGEIGSGLYALICEAGEDHIVAHGMIPNWVIEMTRRQLREKIISESAAQMKCTPDELKPHIDETIVRDMIDKIILQVSVAIFATAKKQDKMLV